MRKVLSLGFMALSLFVGYAAAAGTIAGTIKSPDGTPFRAAFVRAQNLQTKMTTTVLSDNQGKYSADNLAPGTYEVSAISIGYKGDPAKRADIKVVDGQTVTVSFTMQKGVVQWNQLTRYQAGMLLPVPKAGTAEAKDRDVVLHECDGCHFISKWGMRLDHDGWVNAIDVMKSVGVYPDLKPEIADQAATYLSSVFGPDSDTPQSPSQLPGYQEVKREHEYWSDDSLDIEYVDYQLTGEPKDRPGTGRPDKNGNVWVEMGGGLSKLNPKTGEVKTFRLDDPTRPEIHEVFPTEDGSSVWLTITNQNALARFDTHTEKFDPVYKDVYNGPRVAQTNTNNPWPQFRNVATIGDNPRTHTSLMDKEGNIWASGRPLKKFSVKTKEFTNFPNVPDTYGIAIDNEGNIWAGEYTARDYRQLVKVDPKTDKVTKYTPPNADGQAGACRRVHVDSQDKIWCGDYLGGNLLRFDPKTETFKVYKIPGPTPTPYAIGIDNNDNIWYVSFYTDVTGRLDPKTGKFTEYPSPYAERSSRDLWTDSDGRIWFGAQNIFRVGYARLRTRSEMAAVENIK